MEIKEPKFIEGQKVRYIEYGDIYTVVEINRYSFSGNEYWYELETDRKKYTCTRPESKLEPYTEKPKSVWDLKEGDTYYSIYGNGNVSSEEKWFDNDYENNYREIGNVFLTREEAEFEVERRRIETKMIRLGGKRKPEQGKANWFFEYRPSSGGIEILWSSYETDQGVIYFESEEKAKKALEAIGEGIIKKYIFGVEE